MEYEPPSGVIETTQTPPMKSVKNYVALAALASTLATAHGAVVFSDDFSEAPGTATFGKSPDIGQAYTGGFSAPVSAQNSYSTDLATGGLFGRFTSTLGAGQVITVSFDTLATGSFFTADWGGFSLYAGGNERVFLGDAGGSAANTFWAVDGAAIGPVVVSANNTEATSAIFQYYYNTGAWTFTTTSGVNLSGTAAANEAFNEFRIQSADNSNMNVDNIVIDISAVPEPSALALVALGGLAAFTRRRR